MCATRPLDPMAQRVKQAVEARGYETYIEAYGLNEDLDQKKRWVGFEINGIRYLYASGALVERGLGRPGFAGRNINHAAALLMADKHRFKEHLRTHDFPSPRGRFFRRRKLDEARNSFSSFRPPLCVKPNNGSEGKCVFTDLETQADFDHALSVVAHSYANIVIEESVVGTHYRFFYIAPRVAAIRMGRQAEVVGDGTSDIADLVAALNAEKIRRDLPTHPPLEIDDKIIEYLRMQNLTLKTVPAKDQCVRLAGTSNYTAGAESIVVEDGGVHPSYIELAEAACRTVSGLHICGLDLVIADPSVPADESNFWFLEFNASPAILAFYYPWEGPVVDIAGKIIEYLQIRTSVSQLPLT